MDPVRQPHPESLRNRVPASLAPEQASIGEPAGTPSRRRPRSHSALLYVCAQIPPQKKFSLDVSNEQSMTHNITQPLSQASFRGLPLDELQSVTCAGVERSLGRGFLVES